MRLSSVIGMVAISCLSSSALAVGQTASSSGKLTYRSTTREVVVDVVVSNHDKPVLNLREKDFKVFEDGKAQTIDFFEEHAANTLPPGAVPPLPKMPPGVYTNVPPAPENDSVNVLLLDALNTDQADQVYVHNQILKFLKSMAPGTRAAIFTLSSQLRMVQGFTSDSSQLHDALNDPKFGVLPAKPDESRSVQDKINDVEHIEKLIMMANGHLTEGIIAVQAFQRDFANLQAQQRIGMTLEALQTLARYLAAVPGRKNLIWFSSSFPVTIFPDIGETQRPNHLNTDTMRDFGKEVRATADLLTASKIAVYPIGAEGVMSEHIAEANVSSPTDYEGATEGNSTAAGMKGACVPCYVHENAARSDKIMSMEQLARDTGGEAFFNTNDLNAATQKAIADGAHYYTLAYTPTNKKLDGSYRRIVVKVPGEKYRLGYRRGYNADDAVKLISDKAKSNPLHDLMVPGMPDATQILFAARVVPAAPQPAPNAHRAGENTKMAGPTTRYSIDFMIRWTDLKLNAGPDGTHDGKIGVQLLAYDRNGDVVNWAGETQAMKLKPDIFSAIQRSGIPAHLDIDLPSGKDVYLEAGVYDWETGKAGTLRVPLLAGDRLSTQSAKTSSGSK